MSRQASLLPPEPGSRRPGLDVEASVQAFRRLAELVKAGDFDAATAARRELRRCGWSCLWTPRAAGGDR